MTTALPVIVPAPGESSSVSLALVNTLLRPPAGDLLERPDAVVSWFADHALTSARARVRRVDVARLSELRAAVRELFTALADARAPRGAAVAAVNAAAAGGPRAAQLRWPASGPERGWLARRQRSMDAALADLASDAIEVVAGPYGPLLRRCEARGCVRLFLRVHARRRWCSTACGDRVRAARHYARLQHTRGS